MKLSGFIVLGLVSLIPLKIWGEEPQDSLTTDNGLIINEEAEITTITEEPKDTVVLELSYPDYLPWDKVTLQGKLKMKGLPLSPTIKIFMKKDSLISISARAPFVGEAVRIEMNRDYFTAVNKMNKTYVNENISEFLKFYPGGLSDVQNLLLGRFFLPGFDVTEEDLEPLIDIFYEDGQYNVVPKGEAVIEGISYGFVVDDMFRPLMLVALPENKEEMEISVVYNYKLQGYDLLFSYIDGSKGFETTLELKEPEWGGEAPKPIDLEKKYRQLTVSEFINSVGN